MSQQNNKIKRSICVLSTALLLSIGAITLSGCQTSLQGTDMTTDAAYWSDMQNKLSQVDFVSMTGRVNFASDSDRLSSNFLYEGRDNNHYTLKLTSSIGTQIATLTVDGNKATLQTSKHTLTSDSARDLFAKEFQIDLPLDHFHDVMIGRAIPNQSKLNSSNILFETDLEGATIKYNDYKDYYGIAIPSELDITAANAHVMVYPRAVSTIRVNGVDVQELNKAQAQKGQSADAVPTKAQGEASNTGSGFDDAKQAINDAKINLSIASQDAS